MTDPIERAEAPRGDNPVCRRCRFEVLPRKPGGFEAGLQIGTAFEANDLAIAEGPGVRLFLDLAAARTTSVPADGGDHGVAKLEQFMKLMPV